MTFPVQITSHRPRTRETPSPNCNPAESITRPHSVPQFPKATDRSERNKNFSRSETGLCRCGEHEKQVRAASSALTVGRVCYSARSLAGTISVDASKLDLHAKGFGHRPNWLHLIPIDVPGALRYFIRHWIWSRTASDCQVRPFDFTRRSFYGARKWRTWDDGPTRGRALDKAVPWSFLRISGLRYCGCHRRLATISVLDLLAPDIVACLFSYLWSRRGYVEVNMS